MKYKIRRGVIADMNAVMSAHKRSIQEVCSKDYTKEQTDLWSNVNYSLEIWERTITKDIFFVVEIDGTVQGMCHGRNHDNGTAEIMGLYFAPELIGQGVGREVFEKCMSELIKPNPSKVIISATKTAKGFYEAMGFKPVKEVVCNIRGADILTFDMEKTL